MKTILRTKHQRRLFTIWSAIGVPLIAFALANYWLASKVNDLVMYGYFDKLTSLLMGLVVVVDLTVALVLVVLVIIDVAIDIADKIREWVAKGA